jgi:formate dehydrogenase iron-sulfur subunit
LAQLQSKGFSKANIYGSTEAGGLNVFYLFMDSPPVYGQPEHPVVPQRRLFNSTAVTVITAVAVALAALISFRERRMNKEKE